MTLDDVEEGEVAWLLERVADARRLAAARGLEPTPAALDRMLDRAPDPLPDVLGHALGAAFGEHLATRLGFTWQALDDGFQVRLVVEGPAGEVVDPFDLVWRRAAGGASLDDTWRALREALGRDPEG